MSPPPFDPGDCGHSVLTETRDLQGERPVGTDLHGHREQTLWHGLERARVRLAHCLWPYRPAVRKVVLRFHQAQTDRGTLDGVIAGLRDATREPGPWLWRRGSLPPGRKIPATWQQCLEDLRVAYLNQHCAPRGTGQDAAALQVQQAWCRLRFRPEFLHGLVEDFIGAVTRRGILESRLRALCRRAGRRRPTTLHELHALAIGDGCVQDGARNLLQSIQDTGLESESLERVQRDIVIALAALHGEKSRLVERHQHRAIAIARTCEAYGVSARDRIRAALGGLWCAVERFDRYHDAPFTAHAERWIHRAVVLQRYFY